MDHEIMEAAWAESRPDQDGESRFWAVGKPIWTGKAHGPAVTRITVQQDLPGLHCNMRRVCIWIGETMVVEAPLHSLALVGYAIPEGGAA